MRLEDLREEVRLLERILELRSLLGFSDRERPLKATPPSEPVRPVQASGDPQGAQGRPNGGQEVKIEMKPVKGPVGPGDDGVRFEADLSGADALIAQQLTAAFDRENPTASDVDRQMFLGGLPVRIAETKRQIAQAISGGIEAARRDPSAEVIKVSVPLQGP